MVDLGLAGKVRPALVLSVAYDDRDRAIVAVVPHTTSTRGTRFEVRIPKPYLHEGAFDAQGLMPVANVRFLRRIGSLQAAEMLQVEQAVLAWLGISPPTGGH